MDDNKSVRREEHLPPDGLPFAKKVKRREASPHLGGSRGPMAALASFITPPEPAVPVDDLDIELLRMLAADSRLSQRALSREVSLSAPAIGERVARLERLGVIRGYTIDIDWATLGYPMRVHIPITAAPGADFGHIVADLRKMPELEDVHIVTGQWDLIARFRLRDQAHLQEVLLGQVWQIAGIQKVETFLELARFAGDGLLGIDEDPDDDDPDDENGEGEGDAEDCDDAGRLSVGKK